MSGRTRRMRRSGFTLIEIMIAVAIVGCALLGLSTAASTGVKYSRRAREEVQDWAVVQEITDSLLARGIGAVSNGSTTVRGRSVSWTVGAATAPQLVTIIAQRPAYQKTYLNAADTIVVYLAKMTPGP